MSSNGIEPEVIDPTSCVVAGEFTLTLIKRNLNGEWRVCFDSIVIVTLPDGREIAARAPLVMIAKQWGRKPRKKETKPRQRKDQRS